jgi:probable HAF family extracellular repeat protein
MTASLVTLVHAQPPKYIFKDITPKTLNGYTVLGCKAIGIARNGLVGGEAYVTGLNRVVGWTFHNGQYKMIDHDYGSAIITVMGCNSKGQLVGYRDTAEGGERAFISVDGKFVDLPTGPNPDTNALAIGDDGTIIGYGWDSNNSSNPAPAAIWSNGQYGSLESAGKNGVPRGSAAAINEAGIIAGISADLDTGFERATIWENGIRRLVGPPVSQKYISGARCISDTGLIAGRGYRLEESTNQWQDEAFVIDHDGFRVLDKFGRKRSNVNSISGSGRLSGGVWDTVGSTIVNSVAGIFEGDGFFPLENLMTNKLPQTWEPAGFVYQQGTENIAGAYFNEKGNQQAFLAQAVPEPGSMIILCVGFCSALIRKSNK